MANCDKLLEKARNNPKGLRFSDACKLAECYGFELSRINGSHHYYKFPGMIKVVNLQPQKDGNAKKYQVKQILDIISEYFEE